MTVTHSSRDKSPKVVYNPLTRKAEVNVKRKSSFSEDEPIDDEPQLSADQMIAELISESTNELENVEVLTDTLREPKVPNGQNHRNVRERHGGTPLRDEPQTSSLTHRARLESSSSETMPPAKVKTKWAEDSSEEEEETESHEQRYPAEATHHNSQMEDSGKTTVRFIMNSFTQ